jgi:hypothetical protein
VMVSDCLCGECGSQRADGVDANALSFAA